MLFIYIFMVALAAFALVLTSWRMRRAHLIKKKGIYTDAIVTGIHTFRVRGTAMDILTLEYKERATGRSYNAKATVGHQQYRTGQAMTVAYLPDKPARYAIGHKNVYWPVLIFCIVLFLFVLFAVYKINEAVKAGQM
jgi:hypothetical protein